MPLRWRISTNNNGTICSGTNLKAPLFLAQAAAAELRRRHGCIVNIADIHAERPMHGHLLYSVAKAGLVALTKGLAQEMAPQVRVNAVAPGVIVWPENEAWMDRNSAARSSRTPCSSARANRTISPGRCIPVEDAPYITGQIISVDGGRSINL